MLVQSVSIFNLRSIKKLEDIDLSSGLDILIGQNDSGKSTVLTALDTFFDPEKKFNFESAGKNDLSLKAVRHKLDTDEFAVESDEIGVLCKLSLNEEDLKQEKCLLRNYCYDGVLTIIRKSCNESRYEIKTSKRDTAYFALKLVFENDDFNHLDNLTEKDLIELMEKHPDSKKFLVNVNKEGKPENAERIAALLTYAKEKIQSDFLFEPLPFNAKGKPDPIWPDFRLIDTHTVLDGKNKVIDDAFKKIDQKIEQKHSSAIDAIKVDARSEYGRITEQITKYAQENYLPQLESFSAKPTVSLSVARDLVMKRLGQSGDSHFSQQGDGTKRRMMVAILQVSSNVVSEVTDDQEDGVQSEKLPYEPLKIWAFDEPEMHLHPGAQRSLYRSLENFKTKGFQIICSTHSTVFVNNSDIKSAHLVVLDDNHETCIETKNENLDELIKNNLGVRNSDVFFSNTFVILEGETEVEAFPIFYKKYFGRHYGHDDISIVSNGGWTKSKNDFDFLYGCLGCAVCLFDNDVSAKVKITEAEMPGVIKYIGKATFEDAFSNNVWLSVLQADYDLVELNGGTIWTNEILDELRSEIDLNNNHKKFPTMLERHYQQKYRELKQGEFDYPASFNKKELGKKLAHKSIEINEIPRSITEFLEMIKAKLV